MRIFLTLFFISAFNSCAQTQSFNNPVEDPDSILKNQTNFLKYYNTHIRLSENFIAYNGELKEISKENFLLQVSSGGILPLKLISKDTVRYKLYRITTSVDDIILSVLRNIGNTSYKQFIMEGKPIPKFDFTDLQGKLYNSETTRNKIIVLKFWFIGCVKCVEEMPDLNKLVETYRNREDILFISLALDKKEELLQFLKKRKFKYAVVANQRDYLSNNFDITGYPTHIIINKMGLVVKVVNSYEEMEPFLKKESLQ